MTFLIESALGIGQFFLFFMSPYTDILSFFSAASCLLFREITKKLNILAVKKLAEFYLKTISIQKSQKQHITTKLLCTGVSSEVFFVFSPEKKEKKGESNENAVDPSHPW